MWQCGLLIDDLTAELEIVFETEKVPVLCQFSTPMSCQTSSDNFGDQCHVPSSPWLM
jgi:hypothetical protein